MKQVLSSILVLIMLSSTSLYAKTFAIVIGIDTYAHLDLLDGAVNDANDIYAALNENAVAKGDIYLLRNKKATKAAIKAAWDDIVTRSSRGDTLIVSYAGHGAQIPDTGKRDEEDGLDEVFLLSAYEEASRNANEHMILDDEWYRWFAAVADRQVVFVADSCHSGTMSRSLSADSLKSRSQKISTVALPPPSHAKVDIKRKQPDHVTFFAATTENMESYERNINGKARGALSYAFAAAVRGAADNGDKVLRKQELDIYVYNAITRLTAGTNKQIPQIIPESLFAEKALIHLKHSTPDNNPTSKHTESLKVYFAQGKQNASGAQVDIKIDHAPYPYLTLYNLAGNGTIQFLYPTSVQESSLRIATDRPFSLPLHVDNIQGEEQLIALLSKQKQTALHEFLRQRNKSRIDNSFDEELSKLLADQVYDIKRIKHQVQGRSL